MEHQQLGVAGSVQDSELQVQYPTKISITWKILRIAEKNKPIHELFKITTKSKKAIDGKLAYRMNNKFPLHAAVILYEEYNFLCVKLWIIDKSGLKRIEGKIRKLGLNSRTAFEFQFDPKLDSSYPQFDPDLDLKDLIHNDTLAFLIEIEHLETMIKPKPTNGSYTGQLGKGLLSMLEDGELTDCTVVCKGKGFL